MKKSDYIFLFIFALLCLSINFIFQKTPGYLDSEYYFLGGKYLSQGQLEAPFIWNYLDDPKVLPHDLFTYWMPLPSVFTMIPIWIFKNDSFIIGRLLFWFLAAGISPLTALISYSVNKNKFSAYLSALLSIFCGYYFKFLTIPESVTIYIFFGAVFFFLFNKLLESNGNKEKLFASAILGILAGVLHLSRVDGIIFFGIFIIYVFTAGIISIKQKKDTFLNLILRSIVFITCYLLITCCWYIRNLELYYGLFSPASSRVIWIANYDDTYLFPSSHLTFEYWIQNGFPVKGMQIWNAFKNNIGSFLAVQLGIIGIPLFFFSSRNNLGKRIFKIPIFYFVIIFLLMTFVFSESGSRGGYLHSMAAIQIYFWILISDGLSRFIKWGMEKRDWKLKRAQIMFGSALIVFYFLLTIFIYQRDVIGSSIQTTLWDKEANEFVKIEKQIQLRTVDKDQVVMINDPVGYHLATDRWSIVIPSAKWNDLKVLLDKFDVRFIVLDQNLPVQMKSQDQWISHLNLSEIYRDPGGKILYEIH